MLCAKKLNKTEESRRLINEYFTYEKDNRVVRRLDANCNSKEGKVELALNKYTKLILEDKTDTVSMVLLVKLRMRITQLQTPEEIVLTKNILTSVIEISPDHSQAIQLLESLQKE